MLYYMLYMQTIKAHRWLSLFQKSPCKKVLSRFGNCPKVVAIDDYVDICVEDMCQCPLSKKLSRSDLIASCVCSTFSQYSRNCVLKEGYPGNWRAKDFCCKSMKMAKPLQIIRANNYTLSKP